MLHALEKDGLLEKQVRTGDSEEDAYPAKAVVRDIKIKFLLEFKDSPEYAVQLQPVIDDMTSEKHEKGYLNELISEYEQTKNKFGIFSQSQDRSVVIGVLHDALKDTLIKPFLVHADCLKIAEAVNTARLQTHASHTHGFSLFAKYGWTHSRLEKKLNQYLDGLVVRGQLAQDEIDNIKNKENSKPTRYPRF